VAELEPEASEVIPADDGVVVETPIGRMAAPPASCHACHELLDPAASKTCHGCRYPYHPDCQTGFSIPCMPPTWFCNHCPVAYVPGLVRLLAHCALGLFFMIIFHCSFLKKIGEKGGGGLIMEKFSHTSPNLKFFFFFSFYFLLFFFPSLQLTPFRRGDVGPLTQGGRELVRAVMQGRTPAFDDQGRISEPFGTTPHPPHEEGGIDQKKKRKEKRKRKEREQWPKTNHLLRAGCKDFFCLRGFFSANDLQRLQDAAGTAPDM
jgi:hypothetical protein